MLRFVRSFGQDANSGHKNGSKSIQHELADKIGEFVGTMVVFFEHLLNSLFVEPFSEIGNQSISKVRLHELAMLTEYVFVEHI